jgi:hypothetical protein
MFNFLIWGTIPSYSYIYIYIYIYIYVDTDTDSNNMGNSCFLLRNKYITLKRHEISYILLLWQLQQCASFAAEPLSVIQIPIPKFSFFNHITKHSLVNLNDTLAL